MTYNPNIPKATDPLSQSQSEIKTNFSLIDSDTQGFGVDHVQLVAGSNQGKHNQTTYREQTVDPTTIADEIKIWAKATAGGTRLYLSPEGDNPATNFYQFTGDNPIVNTNGETYLPGGVGIKWGSIEQTSGTTAYTYTGLSPALTAFDNDTLGVFLTPKNTTASTQNFIVSTLVPGGFTVSSASNGSQFYFMTIGY